jgi:ABC-type hemin transport system substrate-binding protein
VLVLAGLAAPARSEPLAVKDDRGVIIRLQKPAQRIVTLTPHLTELVFAAGAGKRLAGVARFSNHPPEAKALPVVGDALYVDVERLLALKADLVLAWPSLQVRWMPVSAPARHLTAAWMSCARRGAR